MISRERCARPARRVARREELLKFAALATREVLVLSLCAAKASMSDIGFESAPEHAFDRRLGPELRSQLHLVRSAICRLGRDRSVFERAAPKIFKSKPSSEELQALFTAHAESTNVVVAGSGTRMASQQTRNRRKKGQKAQVAEGAVPTVGPQDGQPRSSSWKAQDEDAQEASWQQ